MKKIYFYLVCFAFFAIEMASCGDNTDFSSKHELTQDEITEIARQDSITQAQKNSINADLVLEYSVDMTISQTLYDGVNLPIETDNIANLFGISVDQLMAGIDGDAGAPEVKGFAIEGTTHADNGIMTNTNATWGHWWNKDGNVTVWGDDAVVFAEFDTGSGSFFIGQYPAHLTDGQTVKFIEALKYNEKRVAVVITVNAKNPAPLTAKVVNTQTLSVNVTPDSDYNQFPVQFDLTKTKSDLGISSMDNIQFVGVNEDGSYSQDAVTGSGFWYDMNGFVGAWGDGASVYTAYKDQFEDEDIIGVGEMPGAMQPGMSVTIQYGFLANNKIEMFKIIVNMVDNSDAETSSAPR